MDGSPPYQLIGSVGVAPRPAMPPPAPRLAWLRRLSDFVIMAGIGLAAVIALLTGLVSSAHVVGPNAVAVTRDHLWLLTGVAGFLFGLSWRFLFWDLPAIFWHLLRYNRHNLRYAALILAGIALLMLV